MVAYLSNKKSVLRLGISLVAVLTLSACEEGGVFGTSANSQDTVGIEGEVVEEAGQKFIEKELEAPEVFSETDMALWDGRPSLGGVWIAHPDVKDPERVLIVNTSTGKEVIGALFRRERDNPGPSLQLSSDAAVALGVVAGTPAQVSVVALRKKRIPVATPITDEPEAGEVEDVETSSLDPITDAANAALEDAPDTKDAPEMKKEEAEAAPAATATAAVKPQPKPEPKPAAKPVAPASVRYVQVGLFSVESNAKNTLANLKKQGIEGKIAAGTSKGNKFWRVLAGPANDSATQKKLIEQVKKLGFTDAYIVKG